MPICCTIPQGQHRLVMGIHFLPQQRTAETRAPYDTSKKVDEEVLVGGGNNKVKQYKNTIPQKNETVHHFCFCLFVFFLQVFIIADVVHQVCDS